MLLCDDSAARVAAESLGHRVHGTVGVIVRAMRTAIRTREQVLELLRQIPRNSTLFLSTSLLESVIAEVENWDI